MHLVRFNAKPFDELRREMERVFADFGLGAARLPLASPAAFPALNIWDAGDALCVEAELPGFSRADVDVFVSGNELTVRGRRVLSDDDARVYHLRDRAAGEFTRAVTLPAEVNAERVEATLKDGVLNIVLPKAEQARPRKIALKTN